MANVSLRNRNSQTKMRCLLEFEQRHVSIGSGQHPRMNKPVRDSTVERRRDAEISLCLLGRTQSLLCCPRGGLSALDDRLCCIELLLGLDKFVARDGSWRLRCFL
jgi:hypothetical protein